MNITLKIEHPEKIIKLKEDLGAKDTRDVLNRCLKITWKLMDKIKADDDPLFLDSLEELNLPIDKIKKGSDLFD